MDRYINHPRQFAMQITATLKQISEDIIKAQFTDDQLKEINHYLKQINAGREYLLTLKGN